MKKLYPTLLFFFFLVFNVHLEAQLTADSVPAGMFSINPYVSVSVIPCGTADSVSFDLNCDNVDDMKIWLYKGYTVIDGANWAYLYILNDSIEVCKDTAGAYSGAYRRPHYFNAGDPIVQTSTSMWAADSVYQFGDYGCMMCFGPYSENNVYIGYRKNAQLSWMKISFNFIDGGSCTSPITVTVSRILSPCTGNFIFEDFSERSFSFTPNPMTDRGVLRSDIEMRDACVVITNCFGQEVKKFEHVSGNSLDIYSGELSSGIFFLHIYENYNLVSSGKFMVVHHE